MSITKQRPKFRKRDRVSPIFVKKMNEQPRIRGILSAISEGGKAVVQMSAATLSLTLWGYDYHQDYLKTMRESKEEIENSHEYSECMRNIQEWHREHGENAPAELKHSLETKGVFSPEAEQINRCRTFTKDYWRKVFSYSETFGKAPLKLEELQSKHRQFTAKVKPLEVFEGYEDELGVYQLPKPLRKK